MRLWSLSFLSMFTFVAIMSCCKPTVSVIAATPPDTLNLTEEANGETVAVHAGTTICIKLYTKPSAGYLWQQAAEIEILQPTGKSSIRPDEIPGSMEVAAFYYKAIRPGSDQIELNYLRPFDKKQPPLRKFIVKVKVLDPQDTLDKTN